MLCVVLCVQQSKFIPKFPSFYPNRCKKWSTSAQIRFARICMGRGLYRHYIYIIFCRPRCIFVVFICEKTCLLMCWPKLFFLLELRAVPEYSACEACVCQGRYGKRRKYGSYIYKNTESSRAIKSEWRFCWENESTSVLTWTSSLMYELTVCACINDLRMFLGGVKMMLGRNDAKSLRQTPTHSLQEPKIENKPWQ